MPLEAPRVQGCTLKRPFEESGNEGRTPKRATKGGLKSIKSEAPMGFDSILTTSPLVKAGSRGSPLGKKNPRRDLLVKNGIIVFGADLVLEVNKISLKLSHALMRMPKILTTPA
ncbi:hypothetical protein [Reinekea sp. G2M2-21]|uniref:hypothetical protein n=1 Tax=Reinekea sp. G2M2-21 TaxID=2788942 RepID=UPI0018AB79FD|nr:hypothetical protein [Reinekea sp. G2M2-21]